MSLNKYSFCFEVLDAYLEWQIVHEASKQECLVMVKNFLYDLEVGQNFYNEMYHLYLEYLDGEFEE